MSALPPFVFALPLLFWSWQGGHWLIGPLAALWLEWAVRTERRWQLAEKEIIRIVDLTSLALVAVVIYRYGSGPVAEGLFAVLHWSPLLLLPLLSAQLLSGRKGIARRALFYSKRRSSDRSAGKEIDLTPVYIGASLLAAGQDSQQIAFYFPGLAVLAAWMLWWQRPRRARLVLWAVLLGLSVALGYAVQSGLRQAQGQLEDAAVEWLTAWFNSDTDPFRTSTALGDVGELKLSDRIIYRVEADGPLDAGLLLRTASYDRYFDTNWLTRSRNFKKLPAGSPGDSWQWQKSGENSRLVTIGAYLEGKQSILPVPIGTWRIESLPVESLSRNGFGAVKVGEGPDLVRYQSHYQSSAIADAPPGESDLRVPKQEQQALAELAAELELQGLPPAQAMQKVWNYFRQQFRYTLELPGSKRGQTALERFLRELKRGHCEYFATATVLLLRQAGIPARYAVGYSVQEPASEANHYLVRMSHAHAWTLVWRDGRWWNLDTTPAVWAEFESKQRPFWQPLFDLFSDLYYRFSLQRLDPTTGGQNPWLWGLLVVLFLVLAYRLRLGPSFRLGASGTVAGSRQRKSTPLAHIEQRLASAGYPRHSWETYGLWLHRLQREPGLMDPCRELAEIRRLHYCHRYRISGLSEDKLQRMQRLADAWLERWSPARLQAG